MKQHFANVINKFSILHIFFIVKERIELSYSLNNTLFQKFVASSNKIIRQLF